MRFRNLCGEHQVQFNITAIMSDESDRVVIAGISGRFPESNSIDEFKQQLFDGVDLITDDDRRWPTGTYGLPARTGKLKDMTHFDASFFGVFAKQAHVMDPQLRLLLEVTHEAMIDAGVNPMDLKGSNTGVFIGSTMSESLDFWNRDPTTINGHGLVGGFKAMLANRISYTFDFTGPSYSIDSACSSSMLGFQQAFDAITTGKCDSAIVGGVSITLNPNFSLHFKRLGLLNPEGKCKAFDSTGDGFVRSEAIAVVFLQKYSSAYRNYATVLGAKTNTDGYKETGITYPSGYMQSRLIREVYAESGVDPNDVIYVEAHGTGTKAGDPEEVNTIADVFCTDKRKSPLLLGSVKSNMGHAEAASGLCSLIKIILAMESGIIPGNLHYYNPKTNVPGLLDGRLKVVTTNHEWNGGIVGANSFGLGGTNVHIILSSYPKQKTSSPEKPIPRIVTVSGRTEDSVNYFLDKIKEHPYDDELYALVDKVHRNNITGHGYRGFCLIEDANSQEVGKITSTKPPVWFVFSGMGSQWPGMGKALMNFEPFRKSIERSSNYLKPHGIDLIDIIVNGDEIALDNVTNTLISIISIQIALVDILKLLEIEPDGMIGHSAGEIGCAYADETITSEQAVLIAYGRGKAILESGLPRGAMASIGLSWEECKTRISSDVYLACHNSIDNVTVSGPYKSIENFVTELTAEGIFAKMVDTSGYAFHSKYVADAVPKMAVDIDALIPNPKNRSRKWISSSIKESDWNTPLAQTSSTEYHVNNFMSPVYFHQAIKHIPDDAIVLEMAPHCLFQSILKRSLNNNINIGLLNKKHPNLKYLLFNIGKIYKSGAQPNIAALYPAVSFPVSKRTPMLASMIKWDHSIEWSVPNFTSVQSQSAESIVEINLSTEEYKFLADHVVDGRILFPATGYMALIWKTFAKIRNQDFEQLSVIMEDVQFFRPIIIPLEGSTKFFVNILNGTGQFEICESDSLVVSGRIYTPDSIDSEFLKLEPMQLNYSKSVLPLNKTDVYKELYLRGYEHDGIFKGIIRSDNYFISGKLAWRRNWITYIDNMLQFYFLGQDTRDLCLPTILQKVVIDPKIHIQLNVDEIPVYMYNDIGVIKSGGIELRGIKRNSIPRRQKNKAPKLEKLQFIPFENPEALLENDTLTVVAQLVIENCMETTKLRVIEVTTEKHSGTYILPKMIRIMEAQPKVCVHGIIISSASVDVNMFENESITVVQNYSDSAANLIILVDALVNEDCNEIAKAVSLTTSGGFLLFEERKKNFSLQLITLHSLDIIYKQVTPDKIYILTRKVIEIPNSPMIIEISGENYNWLEPLKEAIHTSEITGCKIYIFSHDELAGLLGLVNCLKKDLGGSNIRGFFIQDKNAEPFSLSSKYYKIQFDKDLVQNVLKNGVWGTIRHLRLESSKRPVEHACINTTIRGDMSSLRWIETPLKFHNGENMKTVYYASLNFRDVMLATGKLSPDALPDKLPGQDCLFGLEFAGRDCRGKRVMGIVAAKSLATTVICNSGLLWEVPENWSLEEAATIPVVYATGYYALIVRGKMQPGESVLIHSGTGGVGLASISIALHMGCEVFTTVSNQSKRDFLKKRFPKLTDNSIGYSRDTSFEKWILVETKGRGVDLILNSLAEKQLQASIRCLAVGGRFLEIGKVDLSNNTPLGMSLFLRNTTFHGILLESLTTTDHVDKIEVKRLISEGIINGVIQPLPNTVFTEDQVEEAFRFLASGKHIGKISLKIRDEEDRITMNASQKIVRAIPKTYMDPEKVYVLVGGLGGFGLELTDWLISRGARKIVLSSRTGVKTGYQSLCVRRWKNKNVIIRICTADVTLAEGAKELINKSNNLGPVGGIFNLAAVLRDSLINSQNQENFKIVCSPKINATKYLDIASRTLTPYLDYFVVFSSLACGRGHAGQTNYGLANSAMERICEKRHADGLPSLAIQWGPIGDVGFLAENMTEITEIDGTILQSLLSCLSTLDIFLQQCHPVVSTIVLADKESFVKNVDRENLSITVAKMMGLEDLSSISVEQKLSDLGMDSLIIIELKQILERDYDFKLSIQEIRALTFKKLLMLENTCTRSTNEPLPELSCVKMNSSSKTNKNIAFVLPPIEGRIDALENLCKGIDAVFYGLQCTEPITSISKLARTLIMRIKQVQAKGPYLMVGYSFGACVAVEMGLQLEDENEKVSLFLIDGSPDYVVSFVKDDFGLDQTEIITYFLQHFIKVDQERISEFVSMKSWDERFKRLAEIKSLNSPYPAEIIASIDNLYKKLLAAKSYKSKTKFKGEVLLVKAGENIIKLGEDYGLSKICEKKITIITLEYNHRTIVNSPSLEKLLDEFCRKT